MEQRFIAENVFRAVVPENIYRRQEFAQMVRRHRLLSFFQRLERFRRKAAACCQFLITPAGSLAQPADFLSGLSGQYPLNKVFFFLNAHFVFFPLSTFLPHCPQSGFPT